jgi:1-acyl-sn-glycerol-3-phosphate acyltransferase
MRVLLVGLVLAAPRLFQTFVPGATYARAPTEPFRATPIAFAGVRPVPSVAATRAEPASLALLGAGLGALAWYAKARSAAPRMTTEVMPAAEKGNIVSPPLGWHFNVGGRPLNLSGLVFFIISAMTILLFTPIVFVCSLYNRFFDKKRKCATDWAIQSVSYWSSRIWGFNPEIIGLDKLDPNEAYMIVPNHTSFLDIYAISGFGPRMKFISKRSIMKIPFIGWFMKVKGDISLDREDRRSQLATFREAVETLNNKNPVVAFAEGTRSPSGRLGTFKSGPMKMAKSAGVKIVPVSICDVARFFDASTFGPIGPPTQAKVIFHPPIDTTDKTVEELTAETRAVINAGLPWFQQAEFE